jgi:stage II sporulation protein D
LPPTPTRLALPLAVACALLAPPAAAGGETVRIAVEVGVPRTALEGEGLTATPLREGANAAAVAGGRAEVEPASGALRVNGREVDAAGVSFAGRGLVRVHGRSLEGEVEVRSSRSGGLDVVNVLPMEEYVAAVTGAEMPAAFPAEALRAQAVAARTFALFKKLEAVAEGRPWHLGATVLSQVYRGAAVDPRVRAAAEATAGEVLVYDHQPIEAYFHSSCGGRTESGAEALGRPLPYLKSVPCGHCGASPQARWTVRVGRGELGRLVGLPAQVTAARVLSRTASGRAARVAFWAGGRRAALSAVDLRQRLGYQRLPSLQFEVALEGRAVTFHGRGSGHGAGMCQWGAAGLAREGVDHRAILARYYPGTEILRMY